MSEHKLEKPAWLKVYRLKFQLNYIWDGLVSWLSEFKEYAKLTHYVWLDHLTQTFNLTYFKKSIVCNVKLFY